VLRVCIRKLGKKMKVFIRVSYSVLLTDAAGCKNENARSDEERPSRRWEEVLVSVTECY